MLQVKFKTVLIIFAFTLFTLLYKHDNSYASHHEAMSKIFDSYSKTMDAFIKAVLDNNWDNISRTSKEVLKQSTEIKQLGQEEGNKDWKYDSENLLHHAEEVMVAVKNKNRVELIYLIGTLVTHIGYIQSANPFWLKEYVSEQIVLLEEGIKNKNREKARDAAENIHTSANKIIFSLGVGTNTYTHLRWIDDIRLLSSWGDKIIESVNKGNWSTPEDILPKIKLAHTKWIKAFRETN